MTPKATVAFGASKKTMTQNHVFLLYLFDKKKFEYREYSSFLFRIYFIRKWCKETKNLMLKECRNVKILFCIQI